MIIQEEHHKKYKLIGINLSGQTNTSIPPQINFTGKLEEDDGATMFFFCCCFFCFAEKLQKTILNLNYGIIWIMEHQKILNWLNESNDSKFVTRKWSFINDQMQIMM